ncbi:MAG TPA: head GIN domain-containing protein [Allosphingosinicella sp.]|jgi:hypothetical protein|nr:head GIN domain-containing protein [Allosphingosinicella sp.]
MKKLTACAVLAFGLAAAPPSSATQMSAVALASAGTIHEGSRITVQRDGELMVEGSGRAARAARAAAPFTAIEVEGPTTLEVIVGQRESIEVEADDNLLDRITTEVDGTILRIGTSGAFRTRMTPVVRVTVRGLERVKLRGSGDAWIRGIDGDRLDLVLQGSGDLHAEGRAGAVTADLYGSGNMELERLSAPAFDVSLYGTGNVRVHATGTLSAAVYGTGRIAFSGDPQILRRAVYGPGSIARIGR